MSLVVLAAISTALVYAVVILVSAFALLGPLTRAGSGVDQPWAGQWWSQAPSVMLLAGPFLVGFGAGLLVLERRTYRRRGWISRLVLAGAASALAAAASMVAVVLSHSPTIWLSAFYISTIGTFVATMLLTSRTRGSNRTSA